MSTWEDIAKAASTIKTMPIKGKEYAQVPERVKAFRMVHPDGAITTDIISMEGERIVIRATVCDADGRVLATGTAFEDQGSSYINKTSFIENCETSAIGRALGFCGYGIDTAICSAEELQNALEAQKQPEPAKAPAQVKRDAPAQVKKTGAALEELKRFGEANNLSSEALKRWKGLAVQAGMIPEKAWPEFTYDEIKTLETFIIKNNVEE